MTRFDILQRFASDDRTHRDHAFTFLVLSEIWVNEGKPESLELVIKELVRVLKARPGSVYRWLSELDNYGFIQYRRRRNQHEKSTVVFQIAGIPDATAQPEMRQQTEPAYIPDAIAQSQMKQQTASAYIPSETATPFGIQADAKLLVSQTMVPVSEMKQHVPNETADCEAPTQKTAIPANEGINVDNSESAQPFLEHNNNHLINDLIITTKGKVSGDDYVKGVQGKNRKREKRESGRAEVSPFTQSALADIVVFREAFASDSTAKAADLDHYHARLLNWRDKKGNVPERADWLATAKTFILNDYREGKLVTATTAKLLHNAKPRNHSRGAVIEPESTPGRRFGSW